MARFKRLKRRKSKKWFFLVIYTGGLIFVLVLLVLGNFKLSQKRKNLNIEIKSLKDKVGALSQERETLQSEISQSQLPDYLEKVAREVFDLKEEGENVAAFPIVTQKQEVIDTEEKKNFFQKSFQIILEKLKIK